MGRPRRGPVSVSYAVSPARNCINGWTTFRSGGRLQVRIRFGFEQEGWL
jgi:hypothetical protein